MEPTLIKPLSIYSKYTNTKRKFGQVIDKLFYNEIHYPKFTDVLSALTGEK